MASANDTPAMLAQSACRRPESFGRDERDLAVRGGRDNRKAMRVDEDGFGGDACKTKMEQG